MSPPIVIYRYDMSPYANRLDSVLFLKKIPHQRVTVSPIMPRPEILDPFGLNYRRIPILGIGKDLYCDTNLISAVVERRFPGSADGFGTIFPPKRNGGASDSGIIRAFSRLMVENLFFLCGVMVPWDVLPEAFVNDRSTWMGQKIDASAFIASRGSALSTIKAYLSQLEEQLEKSGGDWLFDTEKPSLADVSVGFLLQWIKSEAPAKPLFESENLPRTLAWFERYEAYLDQLKKSQETPKVISADEATAALAASDFESLDIVGFNKTDAAHLGLSEGDMITVTPVDTGMTCPTTGKLVGFNMEEVVVEVKGNAGVFRAHFPKIGYKLERA
ncbi:hypothetical protein K435DRAFT_767813 [Dendrothele bispora CBS 962.96]|uniref:GST N-terminal domain-containing protein n=1 Tax=Dendrothele bispora (strain CBS 962.96) TaxID=1314807 RepID=A0A4S8KY33_DENBC|nr:hypothetical protein K435DRAFT_767813 [Dendrothele bispora CBS 962.96]